MVHMGKTFLFSDSSPRMQIITRLVKEGSITLGEAFLLAEDTSDEHIEKQLAPSSVPPTLWFGTRHPTTGEPITQEVGSTISYSNFSVTTNSTTYNPDSADWSYTK